MADFCPATMKTISYAEAAALIGVKHQTIKQYAMDPSFPKIQLNSKVVRVPEVLFLEWAYNGGVAKATRNFNQRYKKDSKNLEA